MTKFLLLFKVVGLGIIFSIFTVQANIFDQENLKTHLRWNLRVPKEQFNISKNDQTLLIETVNLNLFQDLSDKLSNQKLSEAYFLDIKYSKENYPAKPLSISIKLKDSSVELFTFYRDAEKKYVLDFWINKDLLPEKPLSLNRPLPLPQVEIKKKPAKPRIAKALIPSKDGILPVLEVTGAPEDKRVNSDFRDYRYGASFFWNYPPMIPQLEKDINLSSKIPDALYPIKDRENIDDPKEAHMQLSINFYKSENWGLMNKSITLYEKKYGNDQNQVINQFLKVNSLLKSNIAKPNRGITLSALTMLENIKDMTKDYELKSAALRYLIQHYVDTKDYLKTLELSKELYVEANGQFHYEVASQAALVVLHSLAQLKQVEKIQTFLKENKRLEKILPPQMNIAYTLYAFLARGEEKELIRYYSTVVKSLASPIHPSILFNVGESFFRMAKYEDSIKIFDEFISTYSYLLQSPYARLRLALSYEILDRPAIENVTLYKNAIDRSTSPEIRYEAKLRYVGMRLLRKKNISKEDYEISIFMEQSPDESKIIDDNLKKLLWLVRLRLFIVSKEFDNAISYLTSIPFENLKPLERKVFEADGAEIIYGLIQDAYLKENYSKVVKIWETYKDKYENKVAKNVYINFVVCDSFMKLGLFKSYDRAFERFKIALTETARTFPIWIERIKKINLNEMMDEIRLIRLISDSKWQEAEAMLTSYPVSLRDSLNYFYYLGLVNLKQNKHQEALESFEKVLIKQNPNNQLTPRQTADLLMGYVDALYQIKDQEQFKTIVKALSEDLEESVSAPILNISERITYLLIETYAGDKNTDWIELEKMTNTFRKKFQKSPYSARISYLYGLSLIRNTKVPEGREILKVLTTDKEVPSHIKEMCRSELTALELTEKKF